MGIQNLMGHIQICERLESWVVRADGRRGRPLRERREEGPVVEEHGLVLDAGPGADVPAEHVRELLRRDVEHQELNESVQSTDRWVVGAPWCLVLELHAVAGGFTEVEFHPYVCDNSRFEPRSSPAFARFFAFKIW